MSQVTHQQGKQQVLTRVAQSRVAMLESTSRACRGAEGMARSLPINRAALQGGAVLGGVLLGAGVLRKLLKKAPAQKKATLKLPAPSVPPSVPVGGGLLKYIIVQIVSLVLVPWLRNVVKVDVRVPSRLDYWRPSRVFFRLVGLEK